MKHRVALIAVALFGCAPDLREDFPFDGALPDGEYLTNAAQPDGTTLSTIDATHKESYVYVDLDTAKVVKVGDGWDLSFQRFKVSANGGASGLGPVKVAVIKDGDFAAMSRAPAEGYLDDGSETVINGIEGGWYFYDLGKHRLITKEELFYVVKTDSGYFKLKMKSYYDEAGTPARMLFVWAKVAAP